MSVQNEITRLGVAKSAISTSITNKGVTIPEGTALDAMSGYIDQIVTDRAQITSISISA